MPRKGDCRAPAIWCRGAVPSAPVVGSRGGKAPCEGVVTRQKPVGKRNLPPPGDTKLLSEDIAVSLCRPGGDAELLPELLVRQALGNEFDHLPLSAGDRCGIDERLHKTRLGRACRDHHCPKGVFVFREIRPTDRQ